MATPQRLQKCLLLLSVLLTFSVFASAFPKGILKRSGTNNQAPSIEDAMSMKSDSPRSFISESAQDSDAEGVSDPMSFLNSIKKPHSHEIEWTIAPQNWLDSYFAPKSERAKNIEAKLQAQLGNRMKGKVRMAPSVDPKSPSTDYCFDTVDTDFAGILRDIKTILSKETKGTEIIEDHSE